MRDVLLLLESGRLVEAIVQMLRLWPMHRSAGFADQIDRLGDHLARSVDSIPETRRHAEWLKRLANQQVADVPVLMACFDKGSSKQVKARLDSMVERAPDPRTTRAMLAWVHKGADASFGVWGKVWTALFKVGIKVGDPRLHAGLEAYCTNELAREAALGDAFHDKTIDRIEKALAKFPPPGVEPDLNALTDLLDRICAGPPPQTAYPVAGASVDQDIQEMIYQDPTSDGPIEVWADLLHENGDDLGTWISLQLAAERRTLTGKERATEKRLLKANLVRLLGPLAPVVDPTSVRFRRGLLVAAKVVFGNRALEVELREHLRWGSLTQVQTSPVHLRTGALPLVRRVGMRLVPCPWNTHGHPRGFVRQQVNAPGWTLLTALAKARTPLPIEAICVSLPPGAIGDKQLARLDDRPGLPALSELHLHIGPFWGTLPEHLGALHTHPLLRQVDRLVLEVGPMGLDLQDLFEMYRGAGQELVVLGGGTVAFTMWHDDEGLHVHASCSSSTPSTVRQLVQGLGDQQNLASIAVEGPTWPARLHATLHKALDSAGTVTLPKARK